MSRRATINVAAVVALVRGRRAESAPTLPPPSLCLHGIERQTCPGCGAAICYHPGARCGCGFRPIGFALVGLGGAR